MKRKDNFKEINGIQHKQCRSKTCNKFIPLGKGNICSHCRLKKYKQRNPVKYAYMQLKAGAKYREIPFNISFSNFAKLYAENKGADKRIRRINPKNGFSVKNISFI